MNASLPLSPQVFAILSGLIEERTGLHYGLDQLDLLAERITPRAVERGFDSLLDYYYFLRYDPAADAELRVLVEGLVVNETYFFREARALEVCIDSLLRELVERGTRPRVWSAACATGEEPLTLAMLLDAAGLLDRTTIVASDISQRALAHAKQRTYWRRSLRALPSGVVDRWLEPHADGMRVAPYLFDAIDWRRVNLVDERELLALGDFDLVICRNVLIYFRDGTVERVIENIARCIKPNGWLLVGASESLLRFESSFSCEERSGAFFYRKTTK